MVLASLVVIALSVLVLTVLVMLFQTGHTEVPRP
jgi:cell division protein FtsN